MHIADLLASGCRVLVTGDCGAVSTDLEEAFRLLMLPIVTRSAEVVLTLVPGAGR